MGKIENKIILRIEIVKLYRTKEIICYKKIVKLNKNYLNNNFCDSVFSLPI